jgi:hypothetical protein
MEDCVLFRCICKTLISDCWIHHVCLSIRMEQVSTHWTDCPEISYLSIFWKSYNPPSYSIGRHAFLSGILSVLSGGTVNLLTLVTVNIIYIISWCWHIQIFHVWMRPSKQCIHCWLWYCLHNLSLLAYKLDSSCVRFLKTRKLQVHPP